MGLPIIGDLTVSSQTMGKHLLFICMSQRASEVVFSNKRGVNPKTNSLHSKITRPHFGDSYSILCKKEKSS